MNDMVPMASRYMIGTIDHVASLKGQSPFMPNDEARKPTRISGKNQTVSSRVSAAAERDNPRPMTHTRFCRGGGLLKKIATMHVKTRRDKDSYKASRVTLVKRPASYVKGLNNKVQNKISAYLLRCRMGRKATMSTKQERI